MQPAIDNIAVAPDTELQYDTLRSTLPFDLAGDRLLVDPDPFDENFADTGLKKPVDYKEPYSCGTIFNVGDDSYGQVIPPRQKPGVKVFYWHQQAVPFIYEKKTYHLIRTSDAWGYV